MEIGAHRSAKTELAGKTRQTSHLADIKACAHHFKGVPASRHKGPYELPQPATT